MGCESARIAYFPAPRLNPLAGGKQRLFHANDFRVVNVHRVRGVRPEHLLAAILSATEDGLLSFALDGTI
jgi:hypothetical protein